MIGRMNRMADALGILGENWRYEGIKHRDDNYNLYQDRITKGYFIGTDECPHKVWLHDRHKVSEALSSSGFKKFVPAHLLPAGEPATSEGHRNPRDLSVAYHLESNRYPMHDAHGAYGLQIVDVDITVVDISHESWVILGLGTGLV